MGNPTFGVLANISRPAHAEELERVCKAADRLGYDSLAFGDHLSWPTPEAWTVLAWAAGITDRIGLSHLVLNNTYRHPSLLAKMGASIDLLSDGRFELGIGAGSESRDEYRPYGLARPRFSERVARLQESLTVIERLWETGKCDFDGDYFEIRDAELSPMPIQEPRPPVLVGGQSEALVGLAVEFEGWNFGFDRSPADCENRLEEFRKRCKSVGSDPDSYRTPVGILLIVADSRQRVEEKLRDRATRMGLDPDEFRREYAASFVGTPEEIRPKIDAYLDVGVEEFYLWGPSVRDPEALELFASEVLDTT